jgi:hypothetical protein
MKTLSCIVSSLAVAGLLTACGGGSDDPAPAGTSTTTTTTTTTPTTSAGTAAKYVGTWGGCFSTGAATSRKETLVITQQGAETASFAFTETNYAQLACAGAAGTTSTDSGTVAFTGTKTIGTDTVDQANVTQGNGTQKQVFLVSGTTLKFGKQAGDGGTVDANGYPTTFDTNPLTKI